MADATSCREPALRKGKGSNRTSENTPLEFIKSRRNTTHGRSRSPEYVVWRHIKSRCFNRATRNYADYGGRGITMCAGWRDSFEAFFAAVGPRPSPKHSIERVDNNGHYEPGNCCWATKAQQSRNRRDNVFVEYGGERLTVMDWSKRLGLGYSTMRRRLKRWGVERALTTPRLVNQHSRKAGP